MSQNQQSNSNDTKPGFFSRKLSGLFDRFIKRKPHSFEESVSELIKEHDQNQSIHSEEKAMLQNIANFGDLKASEVMIPRTDIVGVPNDIKLDELKKTFVKEGHTRMPILNDNLDNIEGFAHIKDIVQYIGSRKKFLISDIKRDLIFVPRTMKVIDLLAKMRKSAVHIAIVLDEYGGTDGLITIEDLVEEIVGEIRDEHDEIEDDNFIKKSGDFFVVDARVEIDEIEDKFKVSISDEEGEYETFGGFVLAYLGHIPKTGEKFIHPSGLEIEITSADQRRIKTAKVKLPKTKEDKKPKKKKS